LKIKMKRKNNWFKKGQDASGISFKVILGLIILGIFTFLVIKYLAFGTNDKLDTANSCGVMTGSKGLCKASCDKNTELEFAGFGCDGEKSKCCISKDDDMPDVLLPPTYGIRNNDYDFQVLNIETIIEEENLPKTSQCKLDGDSLLSIRCLAGNEINIPVIINVKNIRENNISVKAYPVIVIKDDGDKVFKGRGTSDTGTTITQNPNPVEIKTTVTIEEDEAEKGSYLKIYPYALCDEEYCKEIDTEGNRGILRKEETENSFLTVLFVDELS